MIMSKSKKAIAEILNGLGIEYNDLTGYAIEEIEGSQMPAITRPAPIGGPSHYDPKTNTGGRRIVTYF